MLSKMTEYYLSYFDRGRIIAYRYVGLSFQEIGRRVDSTTTNVMRVWNKEGRRTRRSTGQYEFAVALTVYEPLGSFHTVHN